MSGFGKIVVVLAVAFLAVSGCTDDPGQGENASEQNQGVNQNEGQEPDAGTEPDTAVDPDASEDLDADPEQDVDEETDVGEETDADQETDVGEKPDVGEDADTGDEPDVEECEAPTDEELCDQANFECGEWETIDVCGTERSVDCGGCPEDDCTQHTCGCEPKHCQQLPDACGLQSDGCGGQILCDSSCANPIAIGARHACIVMEDGGAECWGKNNRGQLGVEEDENANSIDYSTEGVEVDGLTEDIVQIFAGEQHSCARDTEGAIYCWGDNNSRQLTDLAADDEVYSAMHMTNLKGPAQVFGMGGFHACAEYEPGDVECWGDNDFGQLGVGDDQWYDTPQELLYEGTTEFGIAKIEGGPIFGCYLDGAYDLYCWGENTFGQVGNENPWNGGEDVFEPQKVVVDVEAPIQDFSAGGIFQDGSGVGPTISGATCAIDAQGALKCWGYNGTGQLGVDTGESNHSPEAVQVPQMTSGISGVAVGGEHTCAIDSSGRIRCWGYNEFGQLGDGTNEDSIEPVHVIGLAEPAIDIFAGLYHTCALFEGGDFKCWGLNSDGQLGDGTTTDRNQPVSVFQ